MTRFGGILFKLGKPSHAPLSGSHSHKVVINEFAARQSMDTLIGTPLWECCPCTGRHLMLVKIGIIEKAFIEDGSLRISGKMTQNKKVLTLAASGELMGLSFDSTDCHIKNRRSSIYEIEKMTFTGATLLPQNIAAFRTDSKFWLEYSYATKILCVACSRFNRLLS